MSNYLTKIEVLKTSKEQFPFNLPLFRNGLKLTLNKPITFIVGDNGSGKSTLLEGLAYNLGFNLLGGNKNHTYESDKVLDNTNLADSLKLTWKLKTNNGFFFRAESYYEFAKYIENQAYEIGKEAFGGYGGKSLIKQSHGESFLSLFQNRFRDGIFVLDEPESALSIEKQLSLITIINGLVKTGKCQFIIATHSPLLITIPNADIFEIKNGIIEKKSYSETSNFILYKEFINNPEKFLKLLDVK